MNSTKIMKKIVKNSKKSIKNSKITSKISKISKDFIDWLVDIQEDDPVPGEANNVYFIVDFSQNDIVLSYSADDKNLIIFDYGTFFPLEAQYFNSANLKELANKLFVKKNISKQNVFDTLKKVIFSSKNKVDFLKTRNIFFGERFKKIK